MPQYTGVTASPILKEEFDKNVVEAISKRNTTFSWFLKNATKIDINDRGYYFSAKTRRNQGYGSLTAAQEGGIMPRSGTPAFKKIRADYQDHFMAGEMSGRIMDAPDDAALLRMSKNYMMDAEDSFTHFQDFYLFGNGSGALGVVTGGVATTSVVMALAAATPYGATKIQPSQRLNFVDPATGTIRVGIATVVAVDQSTDVVTIDAVIAGLTVGDIAVIEDTYAREMQGFDFHINDANANWLKDGETGIAIPKSTNPWTKGNVTDAAGAALSPAMLDTIALRTTNNKGDGDIAWDAIMLSHPVQQYNYMQLGYALNRTVSVAGNARLDLGFAKVSHNGMEWRTSLNAQADRIYGLTLTDWVMPTVKLPQMYSWPGGQSLIQKYGSDRPYDAVQFYVYARFNVVCKNPSRQWLIKNIAFSVANVRTNVN